MNKRNKLNLQLTLVGLIILVAIIYGFFIKPNYYKFNGGKIYFDTIRSERLTGELSYDIYAYEAFIYICSDNGLKKISFEGESVWDKTYYMKNPKLITDSKYMAVVDIGGKKASLFSDQGLLAEIEVDYPILMADINQEGALVIVQNLNKKHITEIYNRKGQLVVERGTSVSEDGYPIDIAISEDGYNLVTSYFGLNETTDAPRSIITFLNFGDTGKKDPQNIIGVYILEDNLVSEVEFIDENHCVAIGTSQMVFYTINGKPLEETNMLLTNQIEEVTYNASQMIIRYGQPLGDFETNLQGYVVVYNNKGQEQGQHYFDENISSIDGEDNSYYILTKDSLKNYIGGKLQWETDIYGSVKEIRRISKNMFFVLFEEGYEVVKIKDI